MSEQAANKESWSKGLQTEFNKIVWSTPKDVAKQSGAVIAVSVVLGFIIVILDFIVQSGIDFWVNI